jgi:nitrous oxidase accessory protein NosD
MHRTGRVAFAIAFACTLSASPAAAASNHTAVSGLGNDANPCTVAQPCRTMQMAYSNTAVGGEIDVLDPTGYGALVITHAISIEGHGWASMNATATGNAITIKAGPNDAISLHGLILDGLGIGQAGIVVNSSAPSISGTASSAISRAVELRSI